MAYESQYDSKVNDLFNQISNRDKFQYNASDDQLYQQYVDRYMNQGRKAMMDTIGQGAALTGGYNNSYAQNVGQQAYDQYLTGLNDKLMETYQMAYQQYADEGDNLYKLFDAGHGLAQDDFNRYMDEQQLQLQREQFEWQKAMAEMAASGGGGYGGGGASGDAAYSGSVNFIKEATDAALNHGTTNAQNYIRSQFDSGNVSQAEAAAAAAQVRGVGMTDYYKNKGY